MQVDVETVLGLHLKRGLHTGLGEGGLRGVRTDGAAHVLADLRKAGLRVVVLLGVVVAGYPPRGVVAGHGKLGVLFLDDEIVQVLAQGKFVAQSETFVVETETDFHIPLLGGLVKSHEQLVVVVADGLGLTPYGLPGLVEGAGLAAGQGEVALKVGLAAACGAGAAFGGVVFIGGGFELQS